MFSVLGKCNFIFLDIGVEWASLIFLMGEFAAELIPGIHELICKHVLHINYCYDFRVCWGGGRQLRCYLQMFEIKPLFYSTNNKCVLQPD